MTETRTLDGNGRRTLANVALGVTKADRVVRGGRLVNVYTGEIYDCDVAVSGNRVAAIGEVDRTIGPDTDVVDAAGKYLLPGYIDHHCHVHESQLTISEFASAVLPLGTTGVATDHYGEMSVGGMQAVRESLDAAAALPLKVFFILGGPGYYQNHPFGHSGWPTLEDMLEMLEWDECIGMNEAFAARVVDDEEKIISLVEGVIAAGKWVCSHGAEMDDPRANAWKAYLGATDDHESVSAEDAILRARLGIYVSVREGAGCYNLEQVIRAITEHRVDHRRFCFNDDVPEITAIARQGHIDHLMRKAIGAGLPPVSAVQMATLNAAECLGVDRDYGSISPGKIADIVLVDDLRTLLARTVIADGRVVAMDGELTESLPPTRFSDYAYRTVKLPRPVAPADLRIDAGSSSGKVRIRVIEASGETVTTQESHEELDAVDGAVIGGQGRDLLKIAAIERVVGNGMTGVGIVRGFGLRDGALATTFNAQQENIIVVGTNDTDMVVAANALADAGGGFVCVQGGEVRGMLALPLFGLLSEKPYREVVAQLDALNAMVRDLGCDMPSPFPTLGFVGLPVDIGHLKICPEGLVDVWKRAVVPILVDAGV
jgi:adenine deaminase